MTPDDLKNAFIAHLSGIGKYNKNGELLWNKASDSEFDYPPAFIYSIIFKKGLKHIVVKEYYTNWHLRSSCTYINLQKHGKWVGCFSNSKREFEEHWVNGKQHGKSKFWFSSGQLMQTCTFVNGNRHGKLIGYHDNGIKSFCMTFKHGIEHGPYTVWSKRGLMVMFERYNNGKLVRP